MYSRQFDGSLSVAKSTDRRPHPSSTIFQSFITPFFQWTIVRVLKSPIRHWRNIYRRYDPVPESHASAYSFRRRLLNPCSRRATLYRRSAPARRVRRASDDEGHHYDRRGTDLT